MKPPEYPKNNSRSKGAGVTDISRLFDARTFLEARKIWVACRRINFTHWISKLMRAGFRDGQLEFMSYLKADEKYFNQVLTDFEGVDLYSAETAQMISTEHSTAGDLIVTLHYSEQ